VINMGIISRTKEKIRSEIDAYKYNRQLENDPEVVRNRLNTERANVRSQITALKEKKQFESDKRELQTLKNTTGIRGAVSSGLGSLRSHLDSVKKNKSSLRVQDPLKNRGSNLGMSGSGMHQVGSGRSLVTGDVGSKSSSPFATGGVLGSQSVKPRKKSRKQIVINL